MEIARFQEIAQNSLDLLPLSVPGDIVQPDATVIEIPRCKHCLGQEFFFRPNGRALCVDCDSLRQAAGIPGFLADLRSVSAQWRVRLVLPGAPREGRLDVWLWSKAAGFLRDNDPPYLEPDDAALVISAATSKGRAVLQARRGRGMPPVADALQLMCIEEAFVAGAPLVRPKGVSRFVRADSGEDLVAHAHGVPTTRVLAEDGH